LATTFQKVANNAVSTLATTMNTSVTSVVVQSGEGALFPASGSFHITIESEILICTSRSGDTLTVSRAAESTSAASHTEGSQVALNIISKHISDLNTAVNAVETVLATSGGLRGNLSDETGTGGAVFATEPTLTSPVLNTGVSGSAISTDTALGTSNTLLSTQGAVKSYVDTRIATEDTIAELNDTNISSPAAGHILVYDNTASVWDNVALTADDGLTVTLGDGTLELDLDLKSNGGVVIESNELAVDLGASSITGTLAVGDGGTGATTLNDLITMGTHTTGDYVATVTAGTGLTSSGATSGESIAHSLSVDASQGQITTVGELGAGSIATGFGTINNAAAITGTVLTATTNFTMGDTVVTDGVITDTSGLSLAADVTVTGDLIVNGDTVTVNTATLSVEDPLIALATGNGADSVDVGLYAKYTDSGVKYSGLFRDASDSDKWKLFATTGGSHAAPTTTVNTTSGFTLGTLVASAFEGDLTGDVTGNADTVTTNANLTGHVTSTGNAAVLGAFTKAQLSSAVSDGTPIYSGDTISSGTWQGTPVATAYIADNSITLDKLAGGTDGNIISFDANGDPVAIATGNDGQVLTSAGADAPPAFEDAAGGGGGTRDFVASGAIANGDMVILNTDGTVSVATTTGAASAGSTVSTGVGHTEDRAAVYDPSTDRLVVISGNYQSPWTLEYTVGTISGTSISFGTPTEFTGNYGHDPSIAYDPDTQRLLVIYREGLSKVPKARVMTVDPSDNSVDLGSVNSGWTTNGRYMNFNCSGLSYDTTANKFVVAYHDDGGSNYGYAIVATVTGGSTNTVAFGTELAVRSEYAGATSCDYDSGSDRTVIATSGSGSGKTYVGTVSGTSISVGSPTSGGFNSDGYATVRYHAGHNRTIIAGANCSFIGTVTGGSTNTISLGSNTATGVVRPGIAVNTSSNQFVIAGAATTAYNTIERGVAGKVKVCSITGGSLDAITIDSSTNLDSSINYNTSVAFDPDTGLFAVHYSTYYSPTDKVMIFDSGSPDVSTWVGAATAAISDTATGTITIVGGVNESQSSLTVGSKYYIQNGGTIATTVVSGQEVGRALSATNLLITQGSIS